MWQTSVDSRTILWNALKERPLERSRGVFSGWGIYTSPQKLIPSPIDSARRVTSIPWVSHQQRFVFNHIYFDKTNSRFFPIFPDFSRFSPIFSDFSRFLNFRFHSKRQPSVAIKEIARTTIIPYAQNQTSRLRRTVEEDSTMYSKKREP